VNKLKLSLGALLVLASASVASLPVSATNNCVNAFANTVSNNVYTQTNLKTSWNGASQVTVSTKDGKPVCEDATIFFTSYTMPDTWNQDTAHPFNSTAKPQVKFDSVSVTFKKGVANPSATLKVKMPADCKNVQTDLYFAPEVTKIVTTGHGSKLISHKLQPRTGECKVTVNEPPKETPQVLGESTPVELPKTGNSALTGAIVAVVAAAATYAVVLKRQN
jgi:hypothetical protein